jgi:hypothetical protein
MGLFQNLSAVNGEGGEDQIRKNKQLPLHLTLQSSASGNKDLGTGNLWKCILKSTPVGKWRKQNCEKNEGGFGAIVAEALAYFTGSPGTRLALQSILAS